MERPLFIYINSFLLICILGILNNVISYTEELSLSLIYMSLFIIFSEGSKLMIKNIIVSNTFMLMLCYEQLIYLKFKLLIKNLNLSRLILEKKYLKNLFNNLDFEIKDKKNNFLDIKKNINKLKNLNQLLVFILNIK
ncbi:MAG TPA: hypothetical protein PL000_19465 [Anaerolineales bacterium]|nr:hypothetical protein [Anaerolineales bacterium]